MYAEILPEVSINKPLDYLIPEELLPSIFPGSLVKIPLRQKPIQGFVLRIKDHSPCASCATIISVLSNGPVLTNDLFQLALWISSYYATSLGKTIKTMLPSGVRNRTAIKKQYSIVREKTREEICSLITSLQANAPAQAAVLTVMVGVKKTILLTKLLEEAACQPSAVKALIEKKILSAQLVKSDTPIISGEEYFYSQPKSLRDEQKNALDAIVSDIHQKKFAVHLLHGITGSGKTEVYMQAMQECLSIGKTVLVLVPEISLTAQTMQRFKSRFKEPIALLHHRMSDGARHETWNDIKDGKIPIVIGARSAIFSPLVNLGLLIIDEEHDSSYKQTDDSPSYHARDVGVYRAKILQCPIVLGSATPSMESYHNALTGKYRLLTLQKRPENCTLPNVHIVDMRKEYEKTKQFTLFSDSLLSLIEKTTARGEQGILFLNRRGYHTTLTCTQCSTVIQCPHCACSLIFHKSKNLLHCHLCGLERPPFHTCPSCKTPSMMKFSGIGTEKVESMLSALFPHLRILRADADSTRHKGSLEQILTSFRTGKGDILLGTQMIAKGLHFPEVSLVGILQCDASLNIPDFRSHETVFQLIMQVAGRAGRGLTPGTVIIQTCMPDNPIITMASAQEYKTFFQRELSIRKEFFYPPLSHIVKFVYQGIDATQVETVAATQSSLFQKHLPAQFFCHPALPCGHAKISDKWRFQVLIRGPSVHPILACLPHIDTECKIPSHVQRYTDVNPLSTFF